MSSGDDAEEQCARAQDVNYACIKAATRPKNNIDKFSHVVYFADAISLMLRFAFRQQSYKFFPCRFSPSNSIRALLCLRLERAREREHCRADDLFSWGIFRGFYMRADLTVIKRSFVVDLYSRWFIIVGCCEFKYKAKGTNRRKKGLVDEAFVDCCCIGNVK